MMPTYRDGDAVLVDAGAYVEAPPRPGDVVLVAHPFRQATRIIKRVEHITADGRVFVVGDNPSESTDSRSFGPLRPSQILGRVVCATEDSTSL
jgi:nickel-type superoxide dismutase maturation protease